MIQQPDLLGDHYCH